MNITLNFQKAVNKCLTDKKMSQLDLSIITGISQSSICRYLAGKRSPSISQVEIIASALELNPVDLLAYTESITIIKEVIE